MMHDNLIRNYYKNLKSKKKRGYTLSLEKNSIKSFLNTNDQKFVWFMEQVRNWWICCFRFTSASEWIRDCIWVNWYCILFLFFIHSNWKKKFLLLFIVAIIVSKTIVNWWLLVWIFYFFLLNCQHLPLLFRESLLRCGC